MNSSKIDVVVTYVDFNDPQWQKEKAQYDSTFEYSEANTEQRFRTIPFFHHWFRALEENAPWVNRVFFITYGHVPEWLNLNHPKLRVVTHKEFIPEKYLPTYNSNVIELNLHRIEDLGEQFILFNDDMFFNAPLLPEDFFVNDKVKDLAIYAPFIPREEFQHIELNNVIVINKYFEPKKTFKQNLFKFFTPAYGKYNMNNFFALFYKGIFGYKNIHVTLPHLKSTFKEVWKKEESLLDTVCQNRFRSYNDVNHYLMSNWNIETNRFVPQSIKIGKYFSFIDVNDVINSVLNRKDKIICINDDVNDVEFEQLSEEILKGFDKRYPKKSSFEK